MCCFSQPVYLVSDTRIFARVDNGVELLAYSMTYGAHEDLAMVLPLPVPPGSRDDAVRFINLQGYPTLFEDLAKIFPRRLADPQSTDLVFLELPTPAPLKVHDIGSFDASFVPRIADFDRLDPRFAISGDVWESLPQYRDYGFAVFKLKSAIEPKAVHPMAFAFPLRDPKRLFFPTVHIHDGEVHSEAEFDHTLYCQRPIGTTDLFPQWNKSHSVAKNTGVDVGRAQGIVAGNLFLWQRVMSGQLPNEDVWV